MFKELQNWKSLKSCWAENGEASKLTIRTIVVKSTEKYVNYAWITYSTQKAFNQAIEKTKKESYLTVMTMKGKHKISQKNGQKKQRNTWHF